MQPICRVCRNTTDFDFYDVREMMLGTRHSFRYFQCPQCGCLQIETIPEHLGDYYPTDYYSYKSMARFERAPIRRWVDVHRVNYLLTGRDFLGRIFNVISKPLEYAPWIQRAGINKDARILDIGCGQGRLLLRMALGGFRHLHGIDPFVSADHMYGSGVRIFKRTIEEHTEAGLSYDLIMLHHSFEHMPNPLGALQAVARLLAPGGTILLRIPLVDSYAWERYRENWVQLDAPRHLYLHSRRSIGLLAMESGLEVDNVDYDSSKFQFIGSELYARDIPLTADKNERNIFSKQEIQAFTEQAHRLNSEGRGDQAVFYLRAVPSRY